MAKQFYDFSQYDDFVNLRNTGDFTRRQSTGGNYTVLSRPGFFGGKCVQRTESSMNSVTGGRIYGLEANSSGISTDQEVAIEFLVEPDDGNISSIGNFNLGIFLRSDSIDGNNGVSEILPGSIRIFTGHEGGVEIREYFDDGGSLGSNVISEENNAISYSPNTKYRIRASVNNTTVSVKVWDASTPEPSTPTATGELTIPVDSGRIIFGSRLGASVGGHNLVIDTYGWATEGDSADFATEGPVPTVNVENTQYAPNQSISGSYTGFSNVPSGQVTFTDTDGNTFTVQHSVDPANNTFSGAFFELPGLGSPTLQGVNFGTISLEFE